MTYYTPYELAALAQQAGFSGQGEVMAVAIAEAESGGYSDADHPVPGAGDDRGLWQINSYWHPEVSDAQAYDPRKAAAEAFRISQGGQSWTQWATYGNGRYKQFLGEAEKATTPWYAYDISQHFGHNGETGVDVAVPFHVPVSMPYGGTVTDASYQKWGGQVVISALVPGLGNVTEDMIHLDEISPDIKPGVHIAAGQYIGLSGGENPGYPGALHPADPQFSTGPHVEWGLTSPDGTHINPEPYLKRIKTGVAGLPPDNPSPPTTTPVTNAPTGFIAVCDTLPDPISKFLCQLGVNVGQGAAQEAAAIKELALRGIVGVGAAALVLFGLGLVAKEIAQPQLAAVGKFADKVVPV